ncbi:glycosyltransferase [Campylobacter hyointestinalis]|uniref:glycosyltransferase n=1 Tax=Campylobacter hyointestinalis TaxID=198 RepID=UPI000DCDCEE2|nr:glycosyltransferase [Campylobacter hyointestinalis]RAZ49061.1 glycosyltransferase family 4 protein [Campylobacter hyointestinalis subsp. lawsonii]
MKILFFISAIRNGGAERVLQALSNAFLEINHSCEIVYFEEDLHLYDFKCKKTHLNIYQNTSLLSKFSKFITIRKFIKSKKPDVIISFMDQTNINLIISTMFMKRNLIITEHVSHDLLKSRIWRFIRDFSYRFASGLSVLSKADFEYYKFVKNRAIIYNPIFEFKNSENIQKEDIILSVGRLEFVKGYDIYFEALSLIDKNLLKKWKICVAGSGSLEADLKKIALNLGLQIDFLGYKEDIVKLYKKAKILSLSSRSEGLGNVLIESIFYGCARISTPTNGAKELINDGFDGFISEDFSPKAYALKLEKMLKNSDLLSKFSANANLRKPQFKIENIIDQWQTFIKECEK